MRAVRRGNRHLRAVVFDMDGVLFEGENFWLDLHREYGTEREAIELGSRYMSSAYGRLARITAEELWRGRPAEPYLRLVEERRYHPGVAELFALLRDADVRTVLVSSGSDLLAARAQRELGIDEVAANGLGLRDGLLPGELFLRVDDTEKASVARRLLSRVGVSPDHADAVGESDSDVDVARMVAVPIAYNTRSRALLDVASYALPYGALAQIPIILERAYQNGNGREK